MARQSANAPRTASRVKLFENVTALLVTQTGTIDLVRMW